MDKATQHEWTETLNRVLARGGYEAHHLKYSEEMLYGTYSWNDVPSQAMHQVWTFGVCEQGSSATAIRFRVCDVEDSNRKRITKDWPFSTLLKRAEDFVEAGAPLRVVMSLREEEQRVEEAAQEKKAALAERIHKVRLGYVWEHLAQFVWDIDRVSTSVRLEAPSPHGEGARGRPRR